VLSLVWSVGLLAALAGAGWSVLLRNAAEAAAAPLGQASLFRAATVATYVLLLAIINEVVSLPLAFYTGYLLERRYGLTNQNLGGWARDQLKGFAIGLVLSSGAAVVLYWLIAAAPARWWLIAGALFTAFVVGLTQIAPIVVLPLFYRLKPLERETLRTRLVVLAERAGARVLGAYEWGLSAKTRKANAALAGLGATRRILVSDTMLAEYSDDEIEVVLAHELAHHVHRDIWKGVVLESGLILLGFYVSARLLGRVAVPLGLRGAADVAGLPVLLLVAGAVSLVTVPAANALSRMYERRADRFALALTRNPQAFISAMRRLGAQNLAEEQPSKLVQWLFYSHPPLHERIAAAAAFNPRASA
jgi:STE24 endopeptidase